MAILPPGVVIRPATKDDIPSLARVQVQSWRETYRGIASKEFLEEMNARDMARRWERALSTGLSDKPEYERHFLVEDGRAGVVGYAGAGPSRHPQLTYDGELFGIYLLRQFQGRGIGRSLAASAVEFLVKRRFSSMIVWVLEDNHPARKFYEHIGGNLVTVKSTVKLGTQSHSEIAYSWSPLSGLLSLLSSRPLP